MQLVVFDEQTAPISAETETVVASKIAEGPALYDFLSNKELLSIGVPEEVIPRIRTLRSEGDLDRIQGILPVEAYEGLFLISAGDSVDQILRSRETRVDRSIDTGDFASSLEKAETQSRFVVVESDEALTEILNAPLAQWRVFLHPMQKKLAIGNRSGPDAGFGRGRNGQDRVGHAPGPVVGGKCYTRWTEGPLHHVYEELGDRYSRKPAHALWRGDPEEDRSGEPGRLGVCIPARAAIRTPDRLQPSRGSPASLGAGTDRGRSGFGSRCAVLRAGVGGYHPGARNHEPG